jgi:hypothetical protein
MMLNKTILLAIFFLSSYFLSEAQKQEKVKFVKDQKNKRVDVMIGQKLFTSFLYPDTLEKPVLFPVYTAGGTMVTRSFPLLAKSGDPEDHPHHIGIWMNFENVNGLDFWNNSYAIPADKKQNYGWIKTNPEIITSDGIIGELVYHANWTSQQNEILLEETTRLKFSGSGPVRIIDRITTYTAKKDLLFKDAKDGMLAIRLARELQIPSKEEKEFKDEKGIVTVVSAGSKNISNGNYLTSEGLQGDAAWGTRAVWCKVFSKMGNDSVTVAIIDHPMNLNYPTFWHARGYGLFAANPLGKNIFTNGKEATNLTLKSGDAVSFRYRIVVAAGKTSVSPQQLDKLSKEFAGNP